MSDPDDETRQIPPTPAPNDPTMMTPPTSSGGQSAPGAETVAFTPSSGSGVSRPISSSVGSSRSTAPGSGVRRIGDYDLESEIARGGMGIVYKAHQLSLNRPVAFKMILSGQFASTADVERFHVEAEAAAGLDHPNIVPIYEVGSFDGNHFFTMKLIDGRSMAHEMPRLVKSPRDGVRLLAKVCRAIHYAHQHSILHRDLKPANILLDGQGEPHVTDFGLAKRTGGDSQLTQTGTIVGTPSYMAPEQAAPSKVPLTTSADVYSLGAMLYEVLTRRPPFQGDSPLDTLMLVINKEAERPRSINASADRDLETIALKCLEKDPARRYGSAEALAEDLDRWIEGKPIMARPIGSVERIVKWAKRRPAIAALVLAVAAVTLLGVAGVIWQWREAVYQRGQAADALIQFAQAAKAAEDARDQESAQRARAEAARKQEAAARTAADEQKTIAVNALDAAERSAYFNNVSLADHEWAANNIGHADQLLAAAPASLRNWEWHYLSRLSHTEVSSVAAGTQPIVAFAITGDGQRATAIGADLRVRSIDLRTGRVLRTTILDGAPGLELGATSLSPDGSQFAATTMLINRGVIQQSTFVWDVATGRVVLTRGGQSFSPDNAIVLSPSGDRLVTAALDPGAAVSAPSSINDMFARVNALSSKLRVWDVRTGAELSSMAAIPGLVSALSFSRDGSRLAVGAKPLASSTDVVVLDVASGKPVGTLDHSGDTKAVFTPDGRTIAAGTSAGVRVWSANGGAERWTFAGEATLTSFSPDGMSVAAAMSDRSIVVLDAGTGRLRARLLGSAASINGLSVVASGNTIISADAEHLRTFMVPGEAAPLVAEGPADSLAAVGVTPDGRRFVGVARGTLRGWDLTTGRFLYGPTSAPAPSDQPVNVASQAIANAIATNSGQPVAVGNRMLFSADSRRTALIKTTNVTVGGVRQNRNGVRVYDTQTGQEVQAFSPSSDPPDSPVSPAPASAGVFTLVAMGLSLDRSGQHVALATMKAAVSMSGVVTAAGSGSTARGTGIVFRGSDVDVWSAPGERPTTSIAFSDAMAALVELSPDGRYAVVLAADYSNAQQAGADFRIYELRSRRVVASFRGDKQTAPITFSRDGRLVAAETARHTVTVVDLDHPSHPIVLPEQRSTVTRIAISPDNTRIATLSGQGITLFDARTGTQLLALRESIGPYHVREVIVPGRALSGVISLIFTDDGRQIVETIIANDPKGIKVTIKTWGSN